MQILPLLAGALLIAGVPAAAYLVTDTDTDTPTATGAAKATTTAAGADPTMRTTLLRVHHDGEPAMASLAVTTDDGEDVHAEEIELEQGENVLELALDPARAYELSLFMAQNEDDPIFGASMSGTVPFDFAECEGVEVLLATIARSPTTGIWVIGPECIEGPARHVGIETTGPTVIAPVGIGASREGTPVFEVAEGAARIDVLAHWSEDISTTMDMTVWLLTPDDSCGSGCWRRVAEGAGAGEVRFSLEAPPAGPYMLQAFHDAPAGFSLHQDVWMLATVS